MKKYALRANVRTELGRKVKKLRRQNLLPATIYGKNFKSQSVSVDNQEFERVYKEAGETGLIELTLDKQTLPVLIHNAQVDPVSDQLLHAELFKVDLKEKVRAGVPIEVVGESLAVTQKVGVLLTVLDELEVEALPTDLPDKITVDVGSLSEVNKELKVSDLKVPSGVTVVTEPSLTVVKIGALVSKEAEAQVAAEAAAAAAAEEAAAIEAPPAEAAAEVPAEAAAGEPVAKPETEKKAE